MNDTEKLNCLIKIFGESVIDTELQLFEIQNQHEQLFKKYEYLIDLLGDLLESGILVRNWKAQLLTSDKKALRDLVEIFYEYPSHDIMSNINKLLRTVEDK